MDDFKFNQSLYKAVDFLKEKHFKNINIPNKFPNEGIGEQVIEMMASNVLGKNIFRYSYLFCPYGPSDTLDKLDYGSLECKTQSKSFTQ